MASQIHHCTKQWGGATTVCFGFYTKTKQRLYFHKCSSDERFRLSLAMTPLFFCFSLWIALNNLLDIFTVFFEETWWSQDNTLSWRFFPPLLMATRQTCTRQSLFVIMFAQKQLETWIWIYKSFSNLWRTTKKTALLENSFYHLWRMVNINTNCNIFI